MKPGIPEHTIYLMLTVASDIPAQISKRKKTVKALKKKSLLRKNLKIMQSVLIKAIPIMIEELILSAE